MRGVLERLAAEHGIAFDAALLPTSRRLRTPSAPELHYLDWPGAGEPVVLLHGGALSAHTWDLVALALAGEQRLIALDLRGHGLSGWCERYTIPDSVGDVAALAEHLGGGPIHVVGMSLGGNVAAHYAAAPGSRAMSLVLVDVGPGVEFSATANMRDFMQRPIASLSLDQLVDAAFAASTSGGSRDKVLYRYAHMTQVLADGTLAWLADRRRPTDFPHILAKLEELPALAPAMALPVLIVRGGKSRVLSDEKVAAFAALFPRAAWTTIPGAGHNVQEDAPKALADILRSFYCRGTRPSSSAG